MVVGTGRGCATAQCDLVLHPMRMQSYHWAHGSEGNWTGLISWQQFCPLAFRTMCPMWIMIVSSCFTHLLHQCNKWVKHDDIIILSFNDQALGVWWVSRPVWPTYRRIAWHTAHSLLQWHCRWQSLHIYRLDILHCHSVSPHWLENSSSKMTAAFPSTLVDCAHGKRSVRHSDVLRFMFTWIGWRCMANLSVVNGLHIILRSFGRLWEPCQCAARQNNIQEHQLIHTSCVLGILPLPIGAAK